MFLGQTYANPGATYSLPLLDIAGLDSLEELVFKDTCADGLRPHRNALKWPDAFAKYPDLAAKLLEIDGVTDCDVSEWSRLGLKNVKRVRLFDDENWPEYCCWIEEDAFPGLRQFWIEDTEGRNSRSS